MFNNIGNKLKALAQILCWAGIVASFIAALVLWSNSSYRNPTVGTGFIVLIAGSLGSWIGSWTLYAFGQITEDIHAMRSSNEVASMPSLYEQAVSWMQQAEYDKAIELFKEVSPYQDSDEMMRKCYYYKASGAREAGKYLQAAKTFTVAGSYSDAAEQSQACWYKLGTLRLEKGKYDAAYEAFENAGDYQDAEKMLMEVRYSEANELLNHGDKDTAFALFVCLLDYRDVREIIANDPEMNKTYVCWQQEASDMTDGM